MVERSTPDRMVMGSTPVPLKFFYSRHTVIRKIEPEHVPALFRFFLHALVFSHSAPRVRAGLESLELCHVQREEVARFLISHRKWRSAVMGSQFGLR